MRRILTLLAAGLMLAWPVAATAQDRPVVVELFTSQGCSSCPPADALLHDLAKREDVIALAMHVDYWDYIGWKDSFASPEMTARQRAYARKGNRRMVYTPQMIINGQEHVVGNRPKDVEDLIQAHSKVAAPVALDVRREGDAVTITARPESGLTGPVTVQLIRYTPEQTVDIKRGENAGRVLSYANVVSDIRELHRWNGREAVALSAELDADQPAVVLVQGGNPGAVLAAARVE